MRILPAIAAASLLGASLSACQTTSLGAEWGPNTREASRVSYDGDDSVITTREWKRREAGTQERLRFKNGASLYFEELYGGMSVWAFKDDKESLRKIYDSAFGKPGNYQPGEIVMRPFNDYKLFHMSAQSETQKCFLGEGTSNKDRGGWHYVLTMCRSARDAAGAARRRRNRSHSPPALRRRGVKQDKGGSRRSRAKNGKLTLTLLGAFSFGRSALCA